MYWVLHHTSRKPKWKGLCVFEIKILFPHSWIGSRKKLSVDLHQQQGSQVVCQDASLYPSAWSSSQAFLLLPSSALWSQHTKLRKVFVYRCVCGGAYLQFITCGSSTVPYKHQTLVYPCLQPPRWPDHMADHATWSDNGHCSSCQCLNTNKQYMLSHLKGQSRTAKNKQTLESFDCNASCLVLLTHKIMAMPHSGMKSSKYSILYLSRWNRLWMTIFKIKTIPNVLL